MYLITEFIRHKVVLNKIIKISFLAVSIMYTIVFKVYKLLSIKHLHICHGNVIVFNTVFEKLNILRNFPGITNNKSKINMYYKYYLISQV